MPPLRREHERCDTRVDPLTGVCESGEVGDCDRPGSAAPAVPVRRCTSLYVAVRRCRAEDVPSGPRVSGFRGGGQTSASLDTYT